MDDKPANYMDDSSDLKVLERELVQGVKSSIMLFGSMVAPCLTSLLILV